MGDGEVHDGFDKLETNGGKSYRHGWSCLQVEGTKKPSEKIAMARMLHAKLAPYLPHETERDFGQQDERPRLYLYPCWHAILNFVAILNAHVIFVRHDVSSQLDALKLEMVKTSKMMLFLRLDDISILSFHHAY